jgi:hypothetical protein
MQQKNSSRPIEWSSYSCLASPSVADFRFRWVSVHNSRRRSSTSNVHRTQIGNRRWSVEPRSDFPYVAPLPIDFHFRSVFAEGSKASDFERYELDDDCSQNTNSEPRSAYRMVKLLFGTFKALVSQKR